MQGYKLGTWDLSELAGDIEADLQKQISELERLAGKFENNKKKLAPDMPVKRFLNILSEIEGVSERASAIVGHASLSYSADTQSDKTTSRMTSALRLGSEIANRVLFFDLWWKNQVDENNAQRLLKNSGELAGYLAHKRLVAKYSLSESEERIINTLDVTGISALVKLYDKITNAFQYRIKKGGRTLSFTREELTNQIRDTDPRVRENAYRALLTKYAQNGGVIGEIYQNIVLNWNDEGIKIRGYDSAISMRNVGNDVDDKTVKSLLAVCKKNAPIFQKFFVQKAKMINVEKLRRYDLYAPMMNHTNEKRYQYGRSVKMVLDSLGSFSPELEMLARRVFDENHIDSEIRRGKRDGAFCSTLSPKITPYVLVNFTGKTKDVFTLAHELGHAVHSQAARNRSILVQEAPLPLAETASTFSELLLYDRISEMVTVEERKATLAEKIDDFYATIMRQSFFTMFEVTAHEQIASGTTVNDISDSYLRNLKEQFGRSVNVSEDFAIEWSCIPHFYHTPFYCYAYSFGNLLALSLFQRYKKEGSDFVPAYIDILSTGGSKKPENLLEEHGFNTRSPKFWQDGFDYVKGQIRELSKMG